MPTALSTDVAVAMVQNRIDALTLAIDALPEGAPLAAFLRDARAMSEIVLGFAHVMPVKDLAGVLLVSALECRHQSPKFVALTDLYFALTGQTLPSGP